MKIEDLHPVMNARGLRDLHLHSQATAFRET